MIRVDRSPVPASLPIAGAKERKEASDFYAIPANRDKPFDFKAYKGADVIVALTSTFHGKCAYCESSYAPVTPVDVEHFRPKGAVAIEDAQGGRVRVKPGYYWLAAEWDNLLASCPDCNRARTHEFPDDDVTQVAGKENQFPLIKEAKRAHAPGEELTLEADQRLLLHPCRDRPERHLLFLASGVVRPFNGSRKGRASIAVYALGRSELCEARRSHLLALARRMNEVFKLGTILESGGPNPQIDAMIADLMAEIREAKQPGQKYAGMSRQFVAAFEDAIRTKTLKAFVQDLLTQVTTPA